MFISGKGLFLGLSLFILSLLCGNLNSQESTFQHENILAPVESEIDLSPVKTLKAGWYDYEPYTYEVERDGIKKITGLDYELIKAYSRDANINVEYEKRPWSEVLDLLKEGKIDIGIGALYTPERAEYVYYSIPYRNSEAALFVPRGKIEGLEKASIEEILDYFKKTNFRLAVGAGFIYSEPLLNEFIADSKNQNLIVRTKNDYESLDLLINNEIDGFIADRIEGTTLIWNSHPSTPIIEYRLNIKSPTHLIFSKKSVSPEIVDLFNENIQKVKDSEEYEDIVSWYLYPAIVFQIRDALWFQVTEIIGVIAFAISGLVIAFREKATLFGALVLAILPSIGGGLMRDVVLGRTPVGALQSPVYLTTVLITVALGFIIIKLLTHYRKHHEIPGEIEDGIKYHAGIILTITDAIGLATFTVIGVMVSLLAKAHPLWLWGPFFAFLTGAGGGILRDMISRTRYIEALEGEFYGELAIIWGFLLSVFILSSTNQAEPEHIQYAVIITILGVFISRLIVHFMKIPNVRFKKLLK